MVLGFLKAESFRQFQRNFVPRMTTFGVAAGLLFVAAVQLIAGPLAADGLRLYNPESGNRLNHHHNGVSSRSKHGGDPVVKECQFALKLYRQLSSSGDHNVLFSPLSILTAISSLAEGANGTTAEELMTAMNRTAADWPRHRARMAEVMVKLAEKKAGSPHALSAANKIFVEKDYRLLPSFLRTLQRSYKMDAARVDFSDPLAAEVAINDWVSGATSHRITSLVPPGTLDMQTRLVLASAVYFKGDWETMFPEANTRLRPFYYKKDKYVQVPMMSVEAEFPYCDFPKTGFEMLELPYAGREVSMFVVLPHQGQSLGAVTRRLLQRPQLLARPGRRMYAGPITAVLPKFSLERSSDLKQPLAALGVKRVFEQGRADLSGMADTRELYVSDALHQAAVEVSEKGTVAAAATAVVIKGRSMNSDPVFRADRPFVFLIRHNPTESILFVGSVRQLKDGAPRTSVSSN